MTPPAVVLNAIRAVDFIEERQIAGDIVECGVWRGGISMAMAIRLNTIGEPRNFFLYDTFEGMSAPTDHDVAPSGQKAENLLNQIQRNETNHIWAYAPLEKVRKNLETTGYPMEKMRFVKGPVEETIPGTLPEKIALLRLDTDWYESTRHELQHLYPRLSTGGVLILDDYGFWAGARKAVDEFFSSLDPRPALTVVRDGIADSAHWAIKP
ncbi:MAG: TylF/MycF/NovP-related O-methyltransferase [Spartobacteria bacterium]